MDFMLSLWHRITTPHEKNLPAEEYVQTRLLILMILGILALVLVYYGSITLLGMWEADTEEVITVIGGVILWIVAYFLCRRGRVKLAVTLIALSISAMIVILVLNRNERDSVYLLYYFLVPVGISSMFLSTWMIAVFAGMHLLITLLLPAVATNLEFGDLPVIFLVMTSGMIIVIKYHRDWLESHRREVLLQERKFAIEQQTALVVEQERVKLMRQFIKDVSHDIRNPLAAMLTSLHLLKISRTQEQRDHRIELLERHVLSVDLLLDNLVTVNRLEKAGDGVFEFHLGDFNQLAEICFQEQVAIAHDKSIRLEFLPDSRIPQFRFDPDELRRALRQLISNAINYTLENGKVVIVVSHTQDCAIFEVRDTGVGIAPEEVTRIFELFYRVESTRSVSSGLGIGLTICKRIIEAHQGKIEVESTPGVGSKFRIQLPLS